MRSILRAGVALMLLLLPLAPVVGADAVHAGYWLELDAVADTWTLAYLPLPEGHGNGRLDVGVEVTTETPWGEPAAIFSTPLVRVMADGTLDNFPWPNEPATRLAPVGGPLRYEDSWNVGYTADTVGYLVLFASDAPHHARVWLSWGSGSLLRPDFVRQGEATFDRALPVPAGPAGSRELHVDYAGAGWTHVEVVPTPLQPNALREYDVAFPNGERMSGTGSTTGVHAFVIGSWGGDLPSTWGVMADTPGRLDARITTLETGLSAELVAWRFAMQSGDLPPPLAPTSYDGPQLDAYNPWRFAWSDALWYAEQL